MIHTVLVSYRRRPLTEQTLCAYLDTRPAEGTLTIVDNGSDEDVTSWLRSTGEDLVLLGLNYYPGYAANRGFERAPKDVGLLHRLDNDVALLPGWAEAAHTAFAADPELGQYGLVSEEDLQTELVTWPTWPVGGNSIIRRELWDAGLRYIETPWPQIAAVNGVMEDNQMTLDVLERGYTRRFSADPALRYLDDGDESYYLETHRARGLR